MILRVTDDADADTIREAIGHLWAKRNRARDAEVRAECEADVDALLDRLRELADTQPN